MIKIEKDKIIYTNNEFKEIEIESKDLVLHLNSEIKFGEDVTFERFFNILIDNKEIFNLIFSGHMGGYIIDYYIDEFNKEPNEDNEFMENISNCEVYIVFEHMIFSDGKEDNTMYFGFHGTTKKPDELNYGFMGLEICDFKYIPINVNNNVEFLVDTGGKLENKYKTIHKADLAISVFDYIGAVLHEISWFGKPEDRKKEMDKIIEISKRIDSGEEKLHKMKWDDDSEYLIDKDD